MSLESTFYILGIIYLGLSLFLGLIFIIILLKVAQRIRRFRQEMGIMRSILGRLAVWRIVRKIFS